MSPNFPAHCLRTKSCFYYGGKFQEEARSKNQISLSVTSWKSISFIIHHIWPGRTRHTFHPHIAKLQSCHTCFFNSSAWLSMHFQYYLPTKESFSLLPLVFVLFCFCFIAISTVTGRRISPVVWGFWSFIY